MAELVEAIATEITLVKGEDIAFTFAPFDKGGVAIASIERVWFTIKNSMRDEDASAVLKKSSHDSQNNATPTEITIDNPPDSGKIFIKKIDTEDLQIGKYPFDLWIRYDNGGVDNFMQVIIGTVDINKSITDRQA